MSAVFHSAFLRSAEDLIPDILFQSTFPIEHVAAREGYPEDVDIWRTKYNARYDSTDSKESDGVYESDTGGAPATLTDLYRTMYQSPQFYVSTRDIPLQGISLFEAMFGAIDTSLSQLRDVIVAPTAEQLAAGTTQFKSDIKLDACAICQDEIDVDQDLTKLNKCNHTFHASCISPWFTEHTTCPTCRADIRPDDAVAHATPDSMTRIASDATASVLASEVAAAEAEVYAAEAATFAAMLTGHSGGRNVINILSPGVDIFASLFTPPPPTRSQHDSDVD